MGSSPYQTTLYVPRQPLRWEWVSTIFYQLWQHGIHFSYPAPESLTWEGELQSTTGYEVLYGSAGTFEDQLREVITKGETGIYLAMWDGAMPYDLLLSSEPHEENFADLEPLEDADLEEPVEDPPFGHVILYCDVTRINTPILREDMETLLPYLQAYRGFLHWSKLLCEIINPIYAFGYTGMSAISGNYSEHGDRSLQDQLAQGTLPDIEVMLNGGGCCYLAPKDATPERVQQALSIARCSIQRLHNGGLFFTPEFSPYCYENNVTQQYYLLGEMCHGRKIRQQSPFKPPMVREEEAPKYFKYAQTIFTSVEDGFGMRAAWNQLNPDKFPDEM